MRFLATCLLGLSMHCAAQQPPVRIIGDGMAPYSQLDAGGRPESGAVVDLLREVMQRSATRFVFEAYPWARALKLAEVESGVCVFNTVRTPERAPAFKWFGPLADSALVILVRADSRMQLHSLRDLKGVRVGAHLDSAAGQMAADAGAIVDATPSASVNARKLGMGRIDAWIVSREVGLRQAREEKIAVKQILEVRKSPLYLACHPSLPDAHLRRWQQALSDIEADGTRRQILRRYQLSD